MSLQLAITNEDKLRARIAVLEDELAEWRRQAKHQHRQPLGEINWVREASLGHHYNLTKHEARIFDKLLQSPGMRIPGWVLVERREPSVSATNLASIMIHRIRTKVPRDYIVTAHGYGYCVTKEAAQAVEEQLNEG
jgi:DNA-binding response OmpR family regulator